jgi:hypothetical protein
MNVIVLACFLGGCSFNKGAGNRYFACDYYGSTSIKSNEIFKIVNGNKVKSEALDSLIKVLTSLSFPYKGFEVAFDNTGKVEVAKAVIDNYKGYRYIIINANKFKGVDLKNPNEFASVLGVLAHELAHLTYSHGKSTHNNELLADRYAGWVLKKLGIDRGYCIQSLDDYIPQDKIEETSTHPSKGRRIEQMLAGWDRAEVDGRYRYSNCCDTSFFSYFNVEGLVFNQTLNEGKTSFVDFTIRTFDIEGKELEVFGGQIIHDQNIIVEDNKPVILFKDLGWVIKNKKFTTMQFEICSCQQPCDGVGGDRYRRQCRTIQRHVKVLTENYEVPLDKLGFLKLKFGK